MPVVSSGQDRNTPELPFKVCYRNYKKADKQSERKERGLINRAKDERKLMNIRGRKKNEG